MNPAGGGIVVSVTAMLIRDATAYGGKTRVKGTPLACPCCPSTLRVSPSGPIIADTDAPAPIGHWGELGPSARRVQAQCPTPPDPPPLSPLGWPAFVSPCARPPLPTFDEAPVVTSSTGPPVFREVEPPPPFVEIDAPAPVEGAGVPDT